MREYREGEGPREPLKQGHTFGNASPTGNRAERRAYNRRQPKASRRRQAYVVESKSHFWNPDGVCVLHQARCERRPG